MGLVSHGLLAQFQEREADSLRVHQIAAQSSFIASTGSEVPFWLLANNSERISPENARSLLFSLKAQKEARQRTLDYFYGFEAQNAFGNDSRADIIQSYAGVRFKAFDFHAGMREEFFGLSDSTLSIGNLTYGNNARPIPKVVLSTPDWVKSPILGKVFSFKVYLAHGWLERNRHQSGAFIHQKFAYLRSSFLKQKISFTAGVHHHAQWGGTNRQNEISQPAGLTNFARIFFGMPGDQEALQTDRLNALGNHLGTYEFNMTVNLNKFYLSNYAHFIWEDGSGQTISNWRDGLLGISLKAQDANSLVSGVNFEIIRTDDQDAIKYDENGNPFIEPNNYLNNGVYQSGWTYRNRVIGNPIFLIPIPESAGIHRVKNMVNAINIGVEGKVKSVRYTVSFRKYQNSGNYTARFDPDLKLQTILASVTMKLLGGEVTARSSVEWGNYPGNNAGVILSYARSLSL